MKLLARLSGLVLKFTVLLLLVLGLGFIGAYLYVGPQLPTVDSLRETKLQTPMQVQASDGQLIAEFGEIRRIPVRLKDVPKPLIQAVVATEDQRFFEHSGIDPLGIARAAVNFLLTGRSSQGASTITQQVARNFFLSFEKTFTRKAYEIFLALRIEQELSKDEILELYLNKIAYGQRAYGVQAAAQVYYGKDVNELDLAKLAMLAGIPKGPSTHNPISNPEKARARRNHVLARMLDMKYIDRNAYETAIAEPLDASYHGSRATVDAAYFAEAVRQEVVDRLGKDVAYNAGIRVITTLDPKAQNEASQSLRMGLMQYDRRHGWRGAERRLGADVGVAAWKKALDGTPYIANLTPAVVTKLEAHRAELLLKNGQLVNLEWPGMAWARRFISDDAVGAAPSTAADILAIGDLVRVYRDTEGFWQLTQLPAVAGAFVALDPKDGAVLAMMGGFDFQLSKFNRVLQAERQPGSNIKPFVYSSALAKGFTPASIINDAPISFYDKGSNTIWRPKNSNGKFRGPTRLRVALPASTNVVSVRLMDAIGVDYAIDYLQRFGFPKDKLPRNLTLALGTASLTPMQVVTGYAAFANGGYKVEPYLVKRIEETGGAILYEAEPKIVCTQCEVAERLADAQEKAMFEELAKETGKPIEVPEDAIAICPELPVDEAQQAKRIVEARNAYMMHTLMEDVIRVGTATKARALGRHDVAGKTGTTNDARDAWFSGYNRDLVATVWVGFDDMRRVLGAKEFGGKAALPIWMNFMADMLKGVPDHDFPQPPGIVQARINRYTGHLTTEGDPDAVFEIFRDEDLAKLQAVQATTPAEADPFAPGAPQESGVDASDPFAIDANAAPSAPAGSGSDAGPASVSPVHDDEPPSELDDELVPEASDEPPLTEQPPTNPQG